MAAVGEAEPARTSWYGVGTLTVGEVTAQRQLCRSGTTLIGRARPWREGVPLPIDLPRRLATLVPDQLGWHLWVEAGNASVWGPGVRDYTLNAQSPPQVLAPGTWTVTWDVDVAVRLGVLVAAKLDAEQSRLRWAPEEWPDPPSMAGTVYAGSDLTPTQQRRMSVLFRYLIEDEVCPEDNLEVAAQDLGISPALLKSAAHKVREKVNRADGRHVGHELKTLEELGLYLLHTARIIGPSRRSS